MSSKLEAIQVTATVKLSTWEGKSFVTSFGVDARERMSRWLEASYIGRLLEIGAVFAIGIIAILLSTLISDADLLLRQAVIWFGNIVMIGAVWLGLFVRGQSLEHFGLAISKPDGRAVFAGLVKAIIVVFAVLVAVVVGAYLGSLVFDMPPDANLSEYDYLRGNLGLFLLTLVGVFIVSSFGEEFIYRGFLITRLAEVFNVASTKAWYFAGLLSAIIFGLAHYSWGPVGVFQTTLMGGVLSAAFFLVGRRLWILVLAHAFMDSLLMIQVYLGINA